MEEEIIKKIDMLSLRMIEDIKTIVKMPSVEGTFQQEIGRASCRERV